jgi:uncharacterized protein
VRALRVLCLCALLVCGGCTSVVFQPWAGQQQSPARFHLDYHDVYFRSADGVRLHGWFVPAEGAAQGTVLFLHGNAQNISEHVANVAWLPARGYNLLLFDYRGYGLSDGTPSLEGVHADAQAALQEVFKTDGVDPERVVVLGQSLGAAIAVTALADSPYATRVRGLVLDSSFTSLRAIAREKLGDFWLTWPLQWPLSFTVSDALRPVDAIAKVHVPVLIIGGTDDPVVPFHHAQALYAAANEPKTLWEIPKIPHTGTFNLPEYRDKLVGWLKTVMPPPASTAAVPAAHDGR